MPITQIAFHASDRVRAALSAIGRTEDVRFSPSNKLLAIAGFAQKRCLILRVEVEASQTGPKVTLDDFLELTSDSMGAVHGFDFVDDKTLAIANRDGLISILPLPSGELAGRHCKVEPLRNVRGSMFCRVNTPGSVAVRHESNGKVSLLVCNNYINKVTRHVVDPRYRYWVRRSQVLLKQGLVIPDGIAISHDGRWIAVSSHGTHDVKIFDASATLGPKAQPAGILSRANYPHGLRFTQDDKHVLVADAGSPMLHVYAGEGGWTGYREPSRTVAVLDDETFARGSSNPEEGGPKGIDIDRSNTVVAVTCEEQALAFFSLATVVGEDSPETPAIRKVG